MKHMRNVLLMLAWLCAPLALAQEAARMPFSFGVLASAGFSVQDEGALREAIQMGDMLNFAFVVAQGIKHPASPCNDVIYQRRKALLDTSKHGLIVSLGAADWSTCEGSSVTAAVAKLTLVRELFFVDEFSLGATRLPLVRQSTDAKFINFSENARWEVGSVMFATVNLPSNNNHYVLAAGRNGEFEDRLVANREWLKRVFSYATLKKLDGVVLFSEANPLAQRTDVRRDGYAEMRRQLSTLAGRFKGKVLIIHAQPGAPTQQIVWRGNLGEVGVARGWLRMKVEPGTAALFVPGGTGRQ